MKERAQVILSAVAARGGSIPPYASNEYDAYVSDVAAVKAVVDKQSLPAKAAFVSVLVKAAASWGLKKFGHACNLPRPQMFVVKLLAGLGGPKYDARTVSGYMSNRDVLFEMEKRIGSGTMDPKRMPANIQYLIVGPFTKLCLQSKLLVVESADLPLTRKSLAAAVPRQQTAAATALPDTVVTSQAVCDTVMAAFAERGHSYNPAFFQSPDFKSACDSFNGVFEELCDYEETDVE